MSEYDIDIEGALSGEGGVKEMSPGARSADVTSTAKAARTSPPAESARAPRSESPVHVELDAEGIPLDAKVGKAKTETVKRSKVCPAHAPAGTRCKLCGKVHPQRQGRSVKIHIPDDLEAKEDFK